MMIIMKYKSFMRLVFFDLEFLSLLFHNNLRKTRMLEPEKCVLGGLMNKLAKEDNCTRNS